MHYVDCKLNEYMSILTLYWLLQYKDIIADCYYYFTVDFMSVTYSLISFRLYNTIKNKIKRTPLSIENK